MKLECIGTGSIGAKQLSACTLMDHTILIDLPNGVVKRLKQTGHDIMKIKHFFLTHMHGDHFFDVPFLLLEHFFYQRTEDFYLYGPVGFKEKIQELTEIGFPGDWERITENANVHWIEVTPFEKMQIEENCFVTSIEVEHGNLKPAYGYLIEKEGNKIGFSGDTSLCEGLQQIIDESDIIFLDMSFIENKKSHLGLEGVSKIARENPNKKIVSTHMQDYTKEQAIEKKIPNLIVPEEGQIIQI